MQLSNCVRYYARSIVGFPHSIEFESVTVSPARYANELQVALSVIRSRFETSSVYTSTTNAKNTDRLLE